MNREQICLKAADYIESEEYNYFSTKVPACGSPACAIGWIGVAAERPVGEFIDDTSRKILGIDDLYFYLLMREASYSINDTFEWEDSPQKAAAALRHLARTHFRETTIDFQQMARELAKQEPIKEIIGG